MYTFLIAVFVMVCLSLIFIILIQSGKGGGLVSGFASAEQIFGTKTNKYLVRLTGIVALLFFVLTIVIAFMSKERSRSIMERFPKATEATQQPTQEPASAATAAVPAPVQQTTEHKADAAPNSVSPEQPVPAQ